jgi:hypothetical protein
MIDKMLFLVIFITIATVLWHFFPFAAEREAQQAERDAVKKQHALALEAMQHEIETLQQPVALEVEDQPEITASRLVVRHMTDKATLLVRYRARKQACTAHMIIWSGAKRRNISDSYYDLGAIPSEATTEAVVEQFLALAKERLNELATAGQRKRKVEQVKQQVKLQEIAVDTVVTAMESTPVETAPVVSVQDAAQPSVIMEDSPPESTRLKKFPSVYRGIITEIGMMQQSKNGDEFTTFGVRYRSPEGVEDAVYGVNLRVALREAMADVGDTVEIVKIGRRTVEAGRAPMNLFKVAKLPAALQSM